MVKQIFVNLPVKDLNKSIEFFTKLGFKFDQRFTDKNATCMVIGENIFSMLIVEKYFKTFIKSEITDTRKSVEALLALSVNSRKAVDEMLDKVLRAGGKLYRDTEDHGWMYNRSFQDLDGHVWEIFYMNEDEMPHEMKDKKE